MRKFKFKTYRRVTGHVVDVRDYDGGPPRSSVLDFQETRVTGVFPSTGSQFDGES